MIYIRDSEKGRYRNLNITVGYNPPEDKKFDPDENEYCGGEANPRADRLEYICVSPIAGRYVTIFNDRSILTLCEVLVYAEQGKLYCISLSLIVTEVHLLKLIGSRSLIFEVLA